MRRRQLLRAAWLQWHVESHELELLDRVNFGTYATKLNGMFFYQIDGSGSHQALKSTRIRKPNDALAFMDTRDYYVVLPDAASVCLRLRWGWSCDSDAKLTP